MAKTYFKTAGKAKLEASAESLLPIVETFLSTCRSPAVLELGEATFPLRAGEFSLEIRSGRLWIDIWTEQRSLSRRIVAVEKHGTGSLECAIHRFGGSEGKLTFVDLDRPQTAPKTIRAARQNFGEQFKQMLFRQFPGWELTSFSASMDLHRSLSPSFPRARLTKGKRQIAAIACPRSEDEAALMTFALIWFDLVRLQGSGLRSELCLFLPESSGCLTSHRLRWLRNDVLHPVMLRFNGHGSAGVVDPDDLGNLQTTVSPRYVPVAISAQLLFHRRAVDSHEEIGLCPELDGSLRIRSRGAEFARVKSGRLLLGLQEQQEVSWDSIAEVASFAGQLRSIRHCAVSGDGERWLESLVRKDMQLLDSALLPAPVHGQVLTMAGCDRDLVDLLAVSDQGRLCVIELKVSEDLQLPMQALDYWMRLMWHAQRREMDHLFPGIALVGEAPRLLLVAPALSFHSSAATVLRYFSPTIDVERIGINSDWQKGVKVVLRLKGADLPQSHGRTLA